MTVFNFERYYKLALELNRCDDEAKKRSAISRAYYSAYIVCRDFIKINEYFLNKKCKEILLSNNPKAHSELRNVFLNYHHIHNRKSSEFHKKNRLGKKIHDRLQDLREYRNNADYKNEFENLDDYSN